MLVSLVLLVLLIQLFAFCWCAEQEKVPLPLDMQFDTVIVGYKDKLQIHTEMIKRCKNMLTQLLAISQAIEHFSKKNQSLLLKQGNIDINEFALYRWNQRVSASFTVSFQEAFSDVLDLAIGFNDLISEFSKLRLQFWSLAFGEILRNLQVLSDNLNTEMWLFSRAYLPAAFALLTYLHDVVDGS